MSMGMNVNAGNLIVSPHSGSLFRSVKPHTDILGVRLALMLASRSV
jgi:hypothetical protein